MGFLRTFTVEGLNLERFVAAAARQSISLTGLVRSGPRCIRAAAEDGALSRLTALAEEGGWRLTIGPHTGIGKAIDRLLGRWLLVGAAAILLLLCFCATRVMWGVRIVDGGAYTADIRQALTEMNISAPMLRSRINPGKLRDALEWRYPKVAWFECGWRGMVLEIRAVEGSPTDSVLDDGPCDVVASRDGIVSSIVTRAGTPVVKPGQTVRAGEVLIRGEERTSGGETRPVAARGSVFARVWDTASVKTSLYEQVTDYTGRTQTVWTVVSPWFRCWQMPDSGFAQQDISVREYPLGGFFLPLTLRVETRLEANVTSAPRDLEELREENARAALMKLAEITGGKESLIDNWVNWSIIEDEILLSVATGERLVDIARQQRDSAMAAAE